MRVIFVFLLFFSGHSNLLFGQKWISPQYSFEVKKNLIYGKADDFNGIRRDLLLDLCLPQNDIPPDCGRPLLLAVHGGAFLAGSKEDGLLQTAMREFASRGYAAASINYRLGMFQTAAEVHCNVTQLLNTPWDCLNMSDTSEWYRAWFRAVQDVHRAIRFLVDDPGNRIDRRNIFLVGESAGAISVLGAGFLDHPSEHKSQFGNLASLPAPNRIYEDLCIRQPGFNTSISLMDLSRPDLIQDLNPLEDRDYQIRGVAAFYGCSMFDLFAQSSAQSFLPALYLFHQTNDLVVPIGAGSLLSGTSTCFSALAGCQAIISRPSCLGSDPMEINYKKSLSDLGLKGQILYDRKPNNADCIAQVLNPSSGGHQVDDIALRLGNVIRFFAPRISDADGTPCTLSSDEPGLSGPRLFPNPADEYLQIQDDQGFGNIRIFSPDGKVVLFQNHVSVRYFAELNVCDLATGVYYLLLDLGNGKAHRMKLLIH